MGVPNLKSKTEWNYRRGATARRCDMCDHFVPDFEVHGCRDEFLRYEGRCSLIGLGHGRRYRILPHFVCDRFDNAKRIARYNKTC